MALLQVDWNPGDRKVRQFGGLLALFAATLGWWKFGPKAAGVGVILGALTAAAPRTLGLYVYKAWMGVAYVIGSLLSPILLGVLFYGVVTPIGLLLRLSGRDALRLKRPDVDSYWTPVDHPTDPSYFDRLF